MSDNTQNEDLKNGNIENNTDLNENENINEVEEDIVPDIKDSDELERVIDEKGSKKVFKFFKQEKNKLKEEISNIKKEEMENLNTIKKLQNENNVYKERLVSISNEYENYRNRTAVEKEKIQENSLEVVLKEILPILDNIERAIEAAGNNEGIKAGLLLLEKQFEDALSKLGVSVIETDGEFDPEIHSAIMHEEDESLPQNSIVEVFQKGYRKGDKILRHSMVRVAN